MIIDPTSLKLQADEFRKHGLIVKHEWGPFYSYIKIWPRRPRKVTISLREKEVVFKLNSNGNKEVIIRDIKNPPVLIVNGAELDVKRVTVTFKSIIIEYRFYWGDLAQYLNKIVVEAVSESVKNEKTPLDDLVSMFMGKRSVMKRL